MNSWLYKSILTFRLPWQDSQLSAVIFQGHHYCKSFSIACGYFEVKGPQVGFQPYYICIILFSCGLFEVEGVRLVAAWSLTWWGKVQGFIGWQSIRDSWCHYGEGFHWMSVQSVVKSSTSTKSLQVWFQPHCIYKIFYFPQDNGTHWSEFFELKRKHWG